MPVANPKKSREPWVLSLDDLQETIAPEQERLRRLERRERARRVVVFSIACALVVGVQVARAVVRWRALA